ncbi:DUF3267 domain-containing protein [Evansella cellulosilytica]|uniref:DUF3267 domain-containing protein n=1 Tax=Evansella cellulosilytica (strain ATCC 21833 / DSM 2522 / FERM P-1141 / JCM 9156 / N-4) TaxID=649639 RepID=E6TUH4_EVAC2|nr:DUF3267 domain-containing protein [Evansella cellulosilytica]ADU29730.1 hypothetical protein Bcell_1467 [Evansella cellulosilytica DSM 2522]
MNCWRTISIEDEFGKDRLWCMSIFVMLFYFILHFVIFRTFITQSEVLNDLGLIFLVFLILIVGPTHVFLHCLPIWLFGKKAAFSIRKSRWPFIYFSSKQALSKQLILLSMSLPTITITAVCISLSFYFPQWVHYFAMIAALNMGMSVNDLLNLKQISCAPKSAVIEEHQNGYHILCQNQFIDNRS